MIAGIFHKGSGLGNQLHRYVATRVLALDKGYEWGMMHPENFKGHFFKDFDFGKPAPTNNERFHDYDGFFENGCFRELREDNDKHVDVRGYDPRILEAEDNTVIEGEFQDPKYFMHRLDEVRSWLTCDPRPFPIPFAKPEEICVINFRGGEYVGVPDLFLTEKYWNDAIANMRKINPSMKFGVVTDDIETASKFFPNFYITHDIHADWSAINLAHYLILSNSSFAILPALLNKNAKMIIAPKYWARHNVSDGYWAMESNKYPGWYYQDRDGNLEQI